jgi:hypothetical protein
LLTGFRNTSFGFLAQCNHRFLSRHNEQHLRSALPHSTTTWSTPRSPRIEQCYALSRSYCCRKHVVLLICVCAVGCVPTPGCIWALPIAAHVFPSIFRVRQLLLEVFGTRDMLSRLTLKKGGVGWLVGDSGLGFIGCHLTADRFTVELSRCHSCRDRRPSAVKGAAPFLDLPSGLTSPLPLLPTDERH